MRRLTVDRNGGTEVYDVEVRDAEPIRAILSSNWPGTSPRSLWRNSLPRPVPRLPDRQSCFARQGTDPATASIRANRRQSALVEPFMNLHLNNKNANLSLRTRLAACCMKVFFRSLQRPLLW